VNGNPGSGVAHRGFARALASGVNTTSSPPALAMLTERLWGVRTAHDTQSIKSVRSRSECGMPKKNRGRVWAACQGPGHGGGMLVTAHTET
jgi:hypothetical protein